MQHTSSHFSVAFSASTASLAVPRTLSTSNQNKNFSSRNWRRTGTMLDDCAGIVSIRCLCHDWQAYCKGWLMCRSGPLPQVDHLRVGDPIWKLAHIPFQSSVHFLEAADQKFRMLIRGVDTKPLIDAPRWIADEVRKGLVEGSNWAINVLPENEE